MPLRHSLRRGGVAMQTSSEIAPTAADTCARLILGANRNGVNRFPPRSSDLGAQSSEAKTTRVATG
jgi:hypothetical protein